MKRFHITFLLAALLITSACATMAENPSAAPAGVMTAASGHVEAATDLRAALTDTVWQWDGGGGETVVFRADGTIAHAGWTERGLVTGWEVIDRRTVLLEIERGRIHDLYAVLMFKDDLSSFDGVNFSGGSRLKRSRCLEK